MTPARSKICLAAAIAVLVVTGAAAAKPTLAAKCRSAKLKATAKKAVAKVGCYAKAAKKQKLLKKKVLVLKLRAGQACKVTVGTTVKQVRSKSKKRQAQIVRALRLKGKKASLTLQPGKAKTVKVKFTKKTLKAIKKALRSRKRLVATVIVTERVGSAPAQKRTLKITIRR